MVLYQKIAFVFFCGLFLQLPFSAVAQNRNYGLSLEPQYGFLLAHRITMGHLIKKHSYGLNLNVTIQSNGSKKWHHDFNFPETNFAFFFTNLGNDEVLGNAIGLGGGTFLPFFKSKSWRLGAKLDAGVAYITKRYDVYKNPKNNAIGSHLNCLVKAGLQIEKQFNQHSINLNFGVEHFSNGAVKLPNLGLNMPFIGLNYTYYLHPLQILDEATDKKEEEELKRWSFYTQLIASTKQIYPTGGNNYGILTLTNFLHFKVKPKFVIETGAEVIYNQSIIKYYKEELAEIRNIQFGMYGAYVLPINRFQLFVGMGRYMFNSLAPNGWWFHKVGGRFQFTDRLSGNFAVKSHWAKADYFEYGLIYKW